MVSRYCPAIVLRDDRFSHGCTVLASKDQLLFGEVVKFGFLFKKGIVHD